MTSVCSYCGRNENHCNSCNCYHCRMIQCNWCSCCHYMMTPCYWCSYCRCRMWMCCGCCTTMRWRRMTEIYAACALIALYHLSICSYRHRHVYPCRGACLDALHRRHSCHLLPSFHPFLPLQQHLLLPKLSEIELAVLALVFYQHVSPICKQVHPRQVVVTRFEGRQERRTHEELGVHTCARFCMHTSNARTGGTFGKECCSSLHLGLTELCELRAKLPNRCPVRRVPHHCKAGLAQLFAVLLVSLHQGPPFTKI
jgi:hypothetical protein